MDAAPLLPWYLHSGGEAGGWCWWLSVAQGWWCWVEGHLQTHEEPSEAPHRALHSQTGPDSPALLILWSQPNRATLPLTQLQAHKRCRDAATILPTHLPALLQNKAGPIP